VSANIIEAAIINRVIDFIGTSLTGEKMNPLSAAAVIKSLLKGVKKKLKFSGWGALVI